MEPITMTKENFSRDVIQAPVPVLLDFWADWCSPCRMLSPVVDELAGDYAGRVRVAKVNVDREPELAAQFNVASIPTLILFKDGQPVNSAVGVQSRAALRQMLDTVL